jgi:hypothetical protein
VDIITIDMKANRLKLIVLGLLMHTAAYAGVLDQFPPEKQEEIKENWAKASEQENLAMRLDIAEASTT